MKHITLSSLYNGTPMDTIQYLIPGRTTNVELLKPVKSWQSPSRDPWKNCPINSRETTKGQTNYYFGRQKDKTKTICGKKKKTVCFCVHYLLQHFELHVRPFLSRFWCSSRRNTMIVLLQSTQTIRGSATEAERSVALSSPRPDLSSRHAHSLPCSPV